jgi:uncharacterized protein (TIRG00374 family)
LSSLLQLKKYFEGKRLIIPIVLGLSVAFYFFFKDFDPKAYQSISWGPMVVFWFSLALLMVAFRFLGYMVRLRILSDGVLKWKQCFQLVVLWEFASALSPGIVGGTAAAFVLLAQERKLGTGKSTAIVLATSYLDVLYYVLAVPLLLLITGFGTQMPLKIGPFGPNFISIYFSVAYCVLVIWAVIVYVGIFIKPEWVRRMVVGLFHLPFFNKWKSNAQKWGEEIMTAANEFKQKKRIFWFKAFGATFFSWTARFALVVFLILAFGTHIDLLAIFARQLIMWGALLLPVTPGASGLAEVLFPAFLGEYFALPQIANSASVLWRLVSYYPYLILGFIIFPIWLKRILKKSTS